MERHKKKWRWIRILTVIINRVSFPGFDRVPIHEVFSFFIAGIKNGTLTIRASAVAYSFFLAVFPAMIFFFTLIPHIPIDNFQEELLNTIRNLLPENVFLAIQDTIEEIVRRKRFDLLSVGFLTAILFATGGIAALITAFNASYHHIETRSWLNKQLISLALVIIFCVLLSFAVIIIIFSGSVIDFLVARHILENRVFIALLQNGKWIIILAFTFLSISSLFYLAPARKQKFRFFSPGSTLATIFVIITSVTFSSYINNLGQYNKLYGSIGTLIALLIWLFINSLVLLIGFDLNASIKNARVSRQKSLHNNKV